MRPAHAPIARLVTLLLAAVAGLPAWLAPGAASAQTLVNPGVVDEALCSYDYAGLDLSGQSGLGFTLDGVSFAGATLVGTDLASASMACVDDDTLTCNGRCVDLSGANASSARFLGADLSGAIAVGTTFEGANLRSARLDGVTGRASKDGVTSFAGADLTGASLLRVDFRTGDPTRWRTDFTDAVLAHTRADCLYEAIDVEVDDGEGGTTTERVIEISQCPDFTGAIFDGADLGDVAWTLGRYDETSFANANLTGALFKGGDFVGADFAGLALGQATIRDGLFIAPSNVVPGGFDTADFTGADLVGTELSGAILSDPADPPDGDDPADVCNEVIGTVDLGGIAGRDLGTATLRGLHAPAIALDGYLLDDADLTLSDLRCADLRGSDLTRANLSGVDLGGADLGDGGSVAFAPTAFGVCVVPPSPVDELPDPECLRFDGATAQGVMLSGSRLDGASFVGTDLTDADLSSLFAICENFVVDPDLNGGVEQRQFCPSFASATLEGTSFAGASLQGPDFTSTVAETTPVDLSDVTSACATGLVPGEGEDDPPVSVDFCARFPGARLPRAIFANALLIEAEFGCLDPEPGSTVFPDCTDLRGADFDGLTATESTWVAVDLSTHDDGMDLRATSFAGVDLEGATITCQGFTYDVFDMENPPQLVDVVASDRCTDFTGSVLSPDFSAVGAVLEGVDWSEHAGWKPDLSGADLRDAVFGCFQLSYTDAAGETQQLPERCSQLGGAILDGVDLEGATFEGTDLTAASFVGANLANAVFDTGTQFASDYVPDPNVTPDEARNACTTGVPVDLTGVNLEGADLSAVLDFGGSCIKVDKTSLYSSTTTGLTPEVASLMTLVPEPATAAGAAAALGTLGGLARRARRRRRGR